MLAIISDIHLTDGTSNATMAPGAFKLFAERLRDMAEAASWRLGGAYRPLESVNLILLGDMLDLIRSAKWLSSETVRPWHDINSPEGVRLIESVTASVLERNAEALNTLRLISAEGLRIPAANSRGKPERTRYETVPVRTHYMVGNHDWFYHLDLPELTTARRALVEQLGLANKGEVAFPHAPADDPELQDIMRRHRVFARHGDMYDAFNFAGDRSTSSLGDVVVIELLNRFAEEIGKQLVSELPAATLAGLGELDNLRPSLLAPIWIEGLLERSCPLPTQRTKVKRTWDRLVDEFLEIPFIKE